jgi:hypothetical protein
MVVLAQDSKLDTYLTSIKLVPLQKFPSKNLPQLKRAQLNDLYIHGQLLLQYVTCDLEGSWRTQVHLQQELLCPHHHEQ